MNNKKIIGFGFLSALCVSLYVSLVAFIMTNGEKIFGAHSDATFLGPMMLLMILVLSVAIVGTLIFGLPVYFFLSQDKKEGIKQLGFNLLWLAIFVIAFFVILAINK
jgi:hypothetical protein